jgi:hypothetical protein
MAQATATSLSEPLDEYLELLEVVDRCRELLFEESVRELISRAIGEATTRLDDARRDLVGEVETEKLKAAGLTDAQLDFKLFSLKKSYEDFKKMGGLRRLVEALKKGGVLLGSILGAIPVGGSFAQELLDFILKEMVDRLQGRSVIIAPGS